MKDYSNKSSGSSFILPISIVLAVVVMVGIGFMLNRAGDKTQPAVLGASIQASENRKGNPEATIELVEYSDLQCPACASFNPMINQLLAEYGDKINFAYRHFPLNQIHPNAEPAAYAAEAAGKQGKFWEMVDIAFIKQNEWKNSPDALALFVRYAEELGLDSETFIRDYESGSVREKVASDLATAEGLGLNSTPTFFLNGEKISNPGSYEAFVNVLGLAE